MPSVVVTGLLLAACTTGTPAPEASSQTSATTAAATTASPTTSVAASPVPTDVASTEPAAPDSDPSSAAEPTTAPPGATVDVVVTFAGWNVATSAVEVGAYAGTLTAGTCTLRLTGPGGAVATATTTTVPDATTVSCADLSVPRSQVTSGRWSGVVEFTSPNGSGRTDIAPMDIP